jgi:hypothetical protein
MMSVIIILSFVIVGFVLGLIVAIRTFPRREINRLYKEFQTVEKLIDGEFKHYSDKVDHTIRVIVKPNCETLYSTTFLNNPKGIYHLTVPETQNYFSVAFLNENTDVLGYITNENLSKHGASELKIGFDQSNTNVDIQMTAKICWIIIRYGVNNDQELIEARQLQQKTQLKGVHGD